ncbi:hypothetical protein [Flavobacterium phage FL-1]|nr:hypothetical protein [Flavobacterium phage FL-1]
MRTIKNLAVPQNSDPKFPYSTILNETDTNDGTPVVEEIYGDILTNNYKLLQTVDIIPTGTQDSDDDQYQILDALQLLPNKTNDIEQVLSLDSGIWSVPLKIEILPNKYFFLARAAENYIVGSSYTFKGTGTTTYPFSSLGFNSGDEILIIIDQSGVRAYSLVSQAATASEIFTVMGTPVSFNDSNKVWYQDSGSLMSDMPSTAYLESIIRVDVSDGTVLLNDILISNGYALCFCLVPGTNTYFFRQFLLSDLTLSTSVTISGTSFANSSDFSPYVYAESGIVYVTNAMNTTANNYSLTKLIYNAGAATLTFSSTISLDNTFVKTTNAAIKSGLLYTMISGALNSFNLVGGTKVSLGNYLGIAGHIFSFNGFIYFSSGEVAKRWF